MGVIVRVTGATASPKDVFVSATGGSGTTVTLPTLTVTDGFTLLQIAESQTNTTFTPPAGPAELYDQTFATQNYTGAVGLETVGAGATGTRVWTAGSSGVRAGVMYALRAEPPESGTFTGDYDFSGTFTGQAGPGQGSFAGGYDFSGSNFVGSAAGGVGVFTGGYDFSGTFTGVAPTPTPGGAGGSTPGGRNRFTARRSPANRRRYR
jgi:hypothetical protein